MTIDLKELVNLHNIGFKLIPLVENGREIEPWTPIYDNSKYWTHERLKNEAHKFKNVATVFGKTHLEDEQGGDLYLNCLDIDSNNVYNILFNLKNDNTNQSYSLIPKCQQATFVTKTRKKNGFHIFWLSHKQNKSISIEECKTGYGFEIKTDKKIGHCTLPDSTHREDTNFRYKSYGQNKIVVSDGLYDELLRLLKDCLKSTTAHVQEKVLNKENGPYIFEPKSNGIEIRLTEEEIQQICEQIWPYYKKGCNCRNSIVFGLSGLCRKYNIVEDSASKLIEVLARDDEERKCRINVLKETYKKDPKEVSGRKRFLAALEHAIGDNYAAKDIFQKIFKIIVSKWSKEGNKKTDYVIMLTNEIMKENTFKTMKDTQEIYYYDENIGVYMKGGEQIIQEEVELLYPQVCTNQVNEVISHIRRRTLTDRNKFDLQIEWLACKNCMVNLRTMEVRQHSPKFMTTVQIPWNYEPSASCPKIMKFMHEVMYEENVETVLDFIAYCLWRGFPFHKYLVFVGSGRNGKGVMTEIIKRLLGTKNVSGESLQQILTNRFATARLYGKLANVDADLSKEALRNTGVLKKLTGGDLIRAEERFKPPFDYVNYTKLILSANQLPETEDETPAFFSRPMIINFPNQFIGEKADPFLIDKLCTEEELTGLLRMVVERLPRVLQEGIQVKNGSIEETYRNYISISDSTRSFADATIEPDNNSMILKIELYQVYETFCKNKKLTPETEQSFSRKMTKQGFNSKQVAHMGVKDYYWIGIALKEAIAA